MRGFAWNDKRGDIGLKINRDSGELDFQARTADSQWLFGWDIPESGLRSPFNLNQWNHFVVTRCGYTYAMWMNAVKVGSEVSTADVSDTNDSNPFIVGGLMDDDGGRDLFQGALDEFRIFHRCLSDSEIAGLYNHGDGLDGSSAQSLADDGLVTGYEFHHVTPVASDADKMSGKGPAPSPLEPRSTTEQAAQPSASSSPGDGRSTWRRSTTEQAAQPSALELRIAPRSSSLTSAERGSYMDWLDAGRIGYWWKGGRVSGRVPDHVWMPAAESLTNTDQLFTGVYQGQKYLLVSDKPGQTMTPGQGSDAWRLESVTVEKGNAGSPEIHIRLDERGGELLGILSKANIGSKLAMIVDGKAVFAAPFIQSPLFRDVLITGRLSRQEAEALANKLIFQTKPK
jgi:hypothetical protein